VRICPYITFSGNCADAVAFYEKAFQVKADIIRYKDAPPNSGYEMPEGTEDLIMHAQFELNGAIIMFCDMPPEFPVAIGENITVMAEFDDADSARAAFCTLKEGGEIRMEIQVTFWSECFGSLIDKFGIHWNISIGCP